MKAQVHLKLIKCLSVLPREIKRVSLLQRFRVKIYKCKHLFTQWFVRRLRAEALPSSQVSPALKRVNFLYATGGMAPL